MTRSLEVSGVVIQSVEEKKAMLTTGIPRIVNGLHRFTIRFSARGQEQSWDRFYANLEAAETDAPKVLGAEFGGRAHLISVTQAS